MDEPAGEEEAEGERMRRRVEDGSDLISESDNPFGSSGQGSVRGDCC